MRFQATAVCLLIALAGCASGGPEPPAGEQDEPETLDGSAPVRINRAGAGYEPSIRVAEDGTIVVTAHKQDVVHEEGRLASWLWQSQDNGTTWLDLESPAGAHDRLWALEGDLAIDAQQRLYYVDTYLGDQSISRWQLGQGAPRWIDSRPVAGTVSADDRPWLEAHGDGIVYLLSNHGPDAPTPMSVLETGSVEGGDRIWLHLSEDGGLTWEPVKRFTDAWWCGMAASPIDDHTLYVGCFTPGWLRGNIMENYLGENVTYQHWMHASRDRGRSWETQHLYDYEHRNGVLYPKPAIDDAGHAYHLFADDDTDDDVPTRLQFGRMTANGTWNLADVAPFNGSLERIWMDAWGDGRVGITFYGGDQTPASQDSEWHPYALVTDDAQAERPVWHLMRLDDIAAATGPDSPPDFFQNAFGPDGAFHVAYQRDRGDGTGSDIFHVQVRGPW